MSTSLPRTCLSAVLVIACFFAAETLAQGQQLRGQNNNGAKPLLLPILPFSPAAMNNGSLQTTQNPNANLPNQARFIYIAAMPLGDRLGNNGVFYDTNLLPNIGLFQGGQFVGQLGNQGGNNNINNNPFNPNPSPFGGGFPGGGGGFQAARMARAQLIMALAAMQVQPGMMGAYGAPGGFGAYNPTGMGMFGWYDPTMFGWYDPNNAAPPMNNQGFGAGFGNGANAGAGNGNAGANVAGRNAGGGF
jgi:hypothetical protein